MKNLILVSAVLLIIGVQTLNAQKDFCISCHTDLGSDPAVLFSNDVHFKAGLSCSSCHGGNPREEDMELSMSASAGFIGVPSGDKVSEICASCHSDEDYMKQRKSGVKLNQLEDLEKSVHGKKSVSGRERILQCTTCHNAHGIRNVKDKASPVYPTNIPLTCNKCHGNAEFMRVYNASLPVDQLVKYRTSVHGELNQQGNPKAAECASCHGSHNILSSKDVRSTVYKLNIPETCSKCHSDENYMKEFSIPTDQFAKFRVSVHGKAVFERNDLAAPVCNDCHGNHGATPPGIETISNVCGNCHVLNAELFYSSPHNKAFEEKNYPECETCHGNHEVPPATDRMVGITGGALCSKCHSENKNREGYLVAVQMSRLVDTLNLLDSTAQTLVFEAEQKGMEIEEAKFALREVHQAKLEARTLLHSFNEEKFKNAADKGIKAAGYIITDARGAVDEFYFRRYGLAAAVLIISFLIVTIFFYIRRIEARKNL